MKTLAVLYIFLITLNAYSYDYLNDFGVLKSSMKREPQVIRVENVEGQDLIVYKFCDTIESSRCEVLGRKDGYSAEELRKLSEIVKLDAKLSGYLKPVAISVMILAGTGIGILTGVTSLAAMATPASIMSSMKLHSHRESDAEILDRIGRITNPESIHQPMKVREEVSIVKISYILEKKLKNLENPCFVYPDSGECADYKLNIAKQAKKLGERYQYNIH